MRNAGAILAAAALLALSACATTPPERPEVEAPPEKQTYQKGSLWPGGGKKNMLFADNKASRVGDIVTVHVVEKTTAINKSNTTDEHSVNNSLKLDTGAASPTEMELGGGVKFKGAGQTGRSDQLSATVSCIVREVMANGNLVIEGQRRMKINDEEQYIIVRGIARPDDITYNNTLLSSQMANADITYTGAGGMDGGRRPNWLARVLGSLWPF
ncbi:MAG: flagellar basal body L-ring protein FlgH [Candidatus Nitrospinota bacterium M3_3B_026]